ncbi:10126_t:CDS:1, partial [Cetraspora pellucida]
MSLCKKLKDEQILSSKESDNNVLALFKFETGKSLQQKLVVANLYIP